MSVELKGGLIVEEDALGLVLDLEARGHMLTAEDGDLFVSSPSGLTAWDRSEITRWKWHLLTLAAYTCPEGGR